MSTSGACAYPRASSLQQQAIGGELLHPVVPVGQAENALALHAGQQGALQAALEAVDRLDVVEEERQVEDLHLARVLLELGQGRRSSICTSPSSSASISLPSPNSDELG